VSHTPAERIQHTVLCGHIAGSQTRARRGTRNKWLDNVKENCAAVHLTVVEAATQLARNRHCCRETVQHLGCQHNRKLSPLKRRYRMALYTTITTACYRYWQHISQKHNQFGKRIIATQILYEYHVKSKTDLLISFTKWCDPLFLNIPYKFRRVTSWDKTNAN